MKYTDEEIVSYAKCQLRHVERHRTRKHALGIIGGGTLLAVIFLIKMVEMKSNAAGIRLLQDEKFLLGIAMGAAIFTVTTVGAFACVHMFSLLYGIESHVYRLLIKLSDKKIPDNEQDKPQDIS